LRTAPPQDRFQTPKLLEGGVSFMSTVEYPGAKAYTWIVSILMVALLCYGCLALLGVIR
jgi:hypothetical protein